MTDPDGREIEYSTIEKSFPNEQNIFLSQRWLERTANASNFKNNKSKFYHLHIPKTAGNYIRSELTYALEESFKDNDIAFVVGHLGWTPYIDEFTFILNTLRDPAQRTVSHFVFMLQMDYKQEGVVVEDINNPTAKELMAWLDYFPNYIDNYQAKNLLFSAPYPGLMVPNNIFFFKEPEFLNMEIDNQKVWDRAKSIDIQLRDSQLNDDNMLRVRKEIFDSFGIKDSMRPHPMVGYKFHNVTDKSKKLYDQLSQSEVDSLYERNKLDSELYFTDSLFWRGGK
jgi:hypothetical protein